VIDVRAVIAPVTAADAPLDLQIEPSIGATEVTVTELESGAGEPAEIGDTVVVHVLLVRGDNEVVLLNSWEESDVVKVPLGENRAIPGLDGLFEGLEGARVGSRLVIAMPPEDAFGEEGNPTLGLPAGTDLIAVVDVVGIY